LIFFLGVLLLPPIFCCRFRCWTISFNLEDFLCDKIPYARHL
jgi:hypothetical protein